MTLSLKNKTEDLLQKDAASPEDVMAQIRILEGQIRANENLFNLATDEDLVDACILEGQALHLRYCYYLRLAKEQGICAHTAQAKPQSRLQALREAVL